MSRHVSTALCHLRYVCLKLMSISFLQLGVFCTLGAAMLLPTIPPVTHRQARMQDLDMIVEIMVRAMPDDPQWNYRFPCRNLFPNDHWEFTRLRMREFLMNADGQWMVNVAETASNEDPMKLLPVAVSVWNMPFPMRDPSPLEVIESSGSSLMLSSVTLSCCLSLSPISLHATLCS